MALWVALVDFLPMIGGAPVGGFFGSFVATLLSIPVAGALQVIARELWQANAWQGPAEGEDAGRT